MAEPNNPNRARDVLTGQRDVKGPSLQEKVLSAMSRDEARLAAERANALTKGKAERERNDAEQRRLSVFVEELNRGLASIQPPMHGRFYMQGDIAETGAQIFFGEPQEMPMDEGTREQELTRVAQALAMVNAARLNEVLRVERTEDNKALRLSPIGNKRASFPLIEAKDLHTAIAMDDAGRLLDLCAGIDAYNRRTPHGEHAFSGAQLWKEYRQRQRGGLIIDGATLGSSDFGGYDLSNIYFGRKTILRNASFHNADIRGSDFSQVQDLAKHQFDGAITDARTALPAFAETKALPPQGTGEHVRNLTEGSSSITQVTRTRDAAKAGGGADDDEIDRWADKYGNGGLMPPGGAAPRR